MVGGQGGAGCQPALSTLLPVGDRKLAAVFLLSWTSLTVFHVGSSHIFILSVSLRFVSLLHMSDLFRKISRLILTSLIFHVRIAVGYC